MDKNVAVYWDFENIHASLCSVKLGGEWYRRNRYYKQPKVLDISSVMEYISTLGQININKAYANWSFFHPYSYELQDFSVDLIQLFPRGSHGKNGADIRMAMDVIEDINLNQHIETIVILGGDSDYIAIAQKVKQRGKVIIGIGVRETTNQYWMKSCNEFKFYSSLLIKSAAVSDLEKEGFDTGDIDEARELIIKAINSIMKTTGENYARKAAIKPMIQRLEPSFDESNYGFQTFSDMLESCRDIITIVEGEYDHLVTITNPKNKISLANLTTHPINPYITILRKQQIRLPNTNILQTALKLTFRIFQEHRALESFDQYKILLAEHLDSAGLEYEDSDLSKVKSILYKSFCFIINRIPAEEKDSISDDLSLELTSKSISLDQSISSEDYLVEITFKTLIRRILDNIEIDNASPELFSEIFWGDKEHAENAQKFIDEYKTNKQ